MKALKEGDIVQVFRGSDGSWWWYRTPGSDIDTALTTAVRRDLLRGPYRSEKDLRLAVYGRNSTFIDGGVWPDDDVKPRN